MNDATAFTAALTAPGLTLARLMSTVDALEREWPARHAVTVGIASNVSVDLLGLYLRKHALLCERRLVASVGDHDAVIGNAERFASQAVDALVLLPFFDNLLPAFEWQLQALAPEAVDAKLADLRSQVAMALEAAARIRRVFVCGVHRFGAAVDTGAADPVTQALARTNAFLREETARHPNARFVDTASIVEAVGRERAFDVRFYLQSTAPYAPAFLDELARRIMLASRAFDGYFYKALVLDCDNTLWGGIVGEDLVEGIRLDPHAYPGRVYWQVQQAFAALERQGVLLCLCSKNNPADVDEVLNEHPHAVIRPGQIAARYVNWCDKVENLTALARDMNLGLDSLVFVDDSPFECEAVRAALPMVRVFQVPQKLSDYPRLAHEIAELFLAGGVSAESRSKTEQYQRRRAAQVEEARFASQEAYLASLDLRVTLARDEQEQVSRISELTLKSNQFNLTTLRQAPTEIVARMQDPAAAVYSLHVEDRFGKAGLTGVVLVRWAPPTLHVDAFLMSCRVIGRGVEFCFWPTLFDEARARGCRSVEASFVPSAKNAQVEDFYDRLGLPLREERDGVRHYRAELDAVRLRAIDWIQVRR